MNPPPRIAKIIEEVAEKHMLFPADLIRMDRRRAPSRARFEAYARIRDEVIINGLPPSLPRIGSWFSNRDHTSILHGLKVHAREAAE